MSLVHKNTGELLVVVSLQDYCQVFVSKVQLDYEEPKLYRSLELKQNFVGEANSENYIA